MTNNKKNLFPSKTQRGFTIIELLIATAVFSTILLLITITFLGVTRVFYKGVNTTSLQSATRNALVSVTKAVQFSGSGGSYGFFSAGPANPNTDWYCVGSQGYIFSEGQEFTGQISVANPGLLYDPDCPSASTLSSDISSGSVTELLSSSMRVSWFNISPETINGQTLYNVQIQLDFGTDILLCDDTNDHGSCESTTLTPMSSTPTYAPDYFAHGVVMCKSQIGDQFCATSSLSTSVAVEQALEYHE